MKLYFYVFEDGKIEFTECEAEEKQKSYKMLAKVPGVYVSHVLKSEIGLRTECDWKQIVILDKRDDELAKKFLSDYIGREIAKRQLEIDEFLNKLEIINNWEEENANKN